MVLVVYYVETSNMFAVETGRLIDVIVKRLGAQNPFRLFILLFYCLLHVFRKITSVKGCKWMTA